MSDKTETVTEEVELSPELENQLVEKAVVQIEEKMAQKAEAAEATKTKAISEEPKVTASDQPKESKELRMVKGLRALLAGDFATLKAVNEMNIVGKAPYQNETTNADGGYLVPPADFIADIVRLEEDYGVALRDAKVIRTNSNQVIINKKDSGVVMYEMTGGLNGHGEAQAKSGTKMTIGQDTITLRKFAAIAAVTDELTEDAAVNIYNELTRDFARERARWADRLVFTDATTGILNTSGVVAIAGGTALDQLVQMTWQVPTASANGGKFYISRSRFGGLLQAKDTQGRYLLTPGANGTSGTTVWGHPYEVVEVLEETGNRNAVIFGNLQFVTLVVKNGLQLKTLTEATIKDADGGTINLALQDMTAVRAVTRMNARVQFPRAFAVASNGTVS